MICYYCGTDVGNRHYCSRCGADILLYKQIIYTSHVFYNQGLDKAKVNDISGAIESLKNSIQYNKYNTRARNLLGLCYYRIGETVKALNEWILSKNLQDDNPDADRYLAEIENDPNILSRANTNFKKYNQALEYCRQGSRDLATIQLKKVISAAPNLVRAHQLLALLYIQENKFSDARKLLVAANKLDNNNTITTIYLREVKEGLKAQSTGKRKKKDDLVSFSDGNDTVIMSESSFRSMLDDSRSSFVNVILGLAIGLLICFFLVVPEVKESAVSDTSSTLIEVNGILDEQKTVNRELEQEVAKLQESLNQYENKPDVSTSYDNLLEAQMAYATEDYATAIDAYELVTVDILGEQGKLFYEELKVNLAPYIAEKYYNEGNNFYLEGNYESAIVNFKNVVEADENYKDGAALFLLGDCYRMTDDEEVSIEYFNKVVELFPNNSWGKQAKTYLAAGGATTSVEENDNSSARTD